jgi:cytidylate kinase
MPVITVFRKAGCEGRYVSENLAQALGYHLSDYKTVEKIAHEYGMVQFKDIYGSVPDFWDHFTGRALEREELGRMLRAVTLASAKHGDVVMLGRACFAPLQGLSDVINVRVKAALPVRISRIMKRGVCSYEEAAEFVKEKDRLVDSFANFYGVSADDPNAFDLVIDTGKFDPDRAVRFLVETVHGLRATDAERTTADIEVDEVLAEAVARELEGSDVR